jgi:hypothetical protein
MTCPPRINDGLLFWSFGLNGAGCAFDWMLDFGDDFCGYWDGIFFWKWWL